MFKSLGVTILDILLFHSPRRGIHLPQVCQPLADDHRRTNVKVGPQLAQQSLYIVCGGRAETVDSIQKAVEALVNLFPSVLLGIQTVRVFVLLQFDDLFSQVLVHRVSYHPLPLAHASHHVVRGLSVESRCPSCL